MQTVKNKIFEGLYQGSVVEAEGRNLYNFYNCEDNEHEFYFTYNVEEEQFTDKCDMNLSEIQLNKISLKIIEEHKDRMWQDDTSHSVSSQEDLETYGAYELYNPRA